MTANKIKTVALKHFSQKGYDGTSLAEIAGEVGIKKPSIYAHYGSKSELFLAVVESVSEDYRLYRHELVAGTEGIEIERRLYTIFQSIIAYFIKDRVKMAFWVRVWMFPPADLRDAILTPWRNLNGTFVEDIRTVFAQGIAQKVIRQGDSGEWAHTYLCLLDGCLMRVICYEDEGYFTTHLPQVWNCFWSGVKA